MSKVRSLVERIVGIAATETSTNRVERLSFLLGMPGVWLTAAYLYHVRFYFFHFLFLL